MQRPSISIVVPSLDQDARLATTLQSLAGQDYPALEVIIEEQGSADGSLAIAEDFVRRYPQAFRLFAEADGGQAEALNRGFARAQGEILGYLVPGDTLLPGILHRVAGEIDPSRDRFVVMGRCLFSGEGLLSANVEFPARFAGLFDILAIWKRGFSEVPQPAVFWHRQVRERCGEFDTGLRDALDYDLFCRFARHYRFWPVDDFWCTLGIDGRAACSEAELLDLSIKVSRKYWGSWFTTLRWRCEISHWSFARQFHEHARHHARQAETAVREGAFARAFLELVQTLRYSPSMAWNRLVSRWLATSWQLVSRLLSARLSRTS